MVNNTLDDQDCDQDTKSIESIDYKLQAVIKDTEAAIIYDKKLDTDYHHHHQVNNESFYDARSETTDDKNISTNIKNPNDSLPSFTSATVQTVKDAAGNEYILRDNVIIPLKVTSTPPKKHNKSLPQFTRIPPKITRDSSKLNLFQQQQRLLDSLSGFATTSNSRFGDLDTFHQKLKANSSKTSTRSTSSRGSNVINQPEITNPKQPHQTKNEDNK